MAGFPQLIQEDYDCFKEALGNLLQQSEATCVLIVEKAGYLIHEAGDASAFDTTQVATLASNAFNATQFMASLLSEPNFSGMYQQGENFSTLILNIDENCLLVVVFKAALSVGMIKYYSASTIETVARQLAVASERNPDGGFDLADLDPTDVGELFKRKDSGESAAAS